MWRAIVSILCAGGVLVSAQPASNTNQLIARLQDGRHARGTVDRRAPRSIDAAKALAARDLDFAVFDVESGSVDLPQLQASLRALREARGTQPPIAPLARIPRQANDAPEGIVRDLVNLGVSGIMFGHIDTRAQAERAIRALAGHGKGVWPLDPRGELIAVLMIESPVAIRNLEEIVTVPGAGALFFGPGDYSRSIGKPAKLPLVPPETEAATQAMLKACLSRKVACGYPVAGSPSVLKGEADRRVAEGFRLVTQVNLENF